jgi:hypothetical protein
MAGDVHPHTFISCTLPNSVKDIPHTSLAPFQPKPEGQMLLYHNFSGCKVQIDKTPKIKSKRPADFAQKRFHTAEDTFSPRRRFACGKIPPRTEFAFTGSSKCSGSHKNNHTGWCGYFYGGDTRI